MKLRNYYLTMSRMTPLQIAWRFRRLALQQLWRRQRRPFPAYQVGELISAARAPFGHPLPEECSSTILPRAQALCAGEFTFLNQTAHFPHGLPNWTHTPDGDPLWTYNLHYFDYAYDLLWAYQLTNEEAYVQQLAALIDHWIEENPFWQPIAWNPYPLSRRITVWALLLHHLQSCPVLAPTRLDRWASSLCQQVTFLAGNVEYDVDNNHLITNARALVWAGLILEKQPQARQWLQQGLRIMTDEAERQILADGGHWERSTSYQMVVLQDYLETLLLLAHYKHPIPASFTTTAARMFDFLRAIIRPDGQLPLLNDSVQDYPLNLAELFSVGAAYFNRSDLKLLVGAAPNPYLAWLLGPAGCAIYHSLTAATLPQESVALPAAGYWIMRSATATATSYLLFDCGPIGPAHSPAHAHADTLSIELVVGKQPLIVDPGVYEYKAGIWRDRFRSTKYHNTVTVDGQDQSVFWGNFRVATLADAQFGQWQVAPTGVVVEGAHDGYQRLSSPVIHRRRIEHCRPSQWIITDILENSGPATHQYDWWFHLAPAVCTVESATQQCLARFASGNTLSVMVEQPTGVAISLEEGWLAPKWKEKEPAPVLRFAYTFAGPKLELKTILTLLA